MRKDYNSPGRRIRSWHAYEEGKCLQKSSFFVVFAFSSFSTLAFFVWLSLNNYRSKLSYASCMKLMKNRIHFQGKQLIRHAQHGPATTADGWLVTRRQKKKDSPPLEIIVIISLSLSLTHFLGFHFQWEQFGVVICL
jgi:hypothetical protein